MRHQFFFATMRHQQRKDDMKDMAFPTSTEQEYGMTLRDYFAAKAMQGFCASAQDGDNVEEIPELSYLMADAMMKARK